MEGCFDEWSDACLADVKDVCCVQGRGGRFPSVLCSDFLVDGVGIIVCVEGSFTFRCEGIDYMARGGETVFLSQGVVFKAVGRLLLQSNIIQGGHDKEYTRQHHSCHETA